MSVTRYAARSPLIASLALLSCLTLAARPAPAQTKRDPAVQSASPAQAAPALTARLQRALDQYLRTRARPEHISAVSLCISLPGGRPPLRLVSGKVSRAPGAAPVTPDSLFQIGSITKSFTAATLLQLEAEGKLSMDQTVGRWLPQYPAWKGVTIRRLLNMTSSIPTYSEDVRFSRAVAHNIHRRWTPAQLVAFVDPVYGHAPAPTKGYDYSNTNYVLAGLIVERVTGTSLATQFRRRFLGSRYGMTRTYYEPAVYPPSILARQVSGYFFNSDPDQAALAPLMGQDLKTGDLSWAEAAGGIVSEPLDVMRWARALHGGKVLPARQLHEMMRLVSLKTGKPVAHTSAADPQAFGLGIVEATRPPMGTFWFYEGMTLGYRMVYAWLPGSDTVLAVGLNSQPRARENHVGQLLTQVYQILRQSGAIRPNDRPAH